LTLRKILFIPGFLKDQETVQLLEQKVVEIQPLFQYFGWKIIPSNCYGGEPSLLPISEYAKRVAEEIKEIRPDAIIAHSMGTLIIRGSWKHYRGFRGPIVFIEGPNMGAAWWKLLITGFPLWRACVRDMMPNSSFMESVKNDCPPQNNFVSEIHGRLSRHPLAGNVFDPLPYSRTVLLFADVGHRELVTDKWTIKAVFSLLNYAV
jgi:hypothetical protein